MTSVAKYENSVVAVPEYGTVGHVSVPAVEQQRARALLRAMWERGEIGPDLFNVRQEKDAETGHLMWRASYTRLRPARMNVPVPIVFAAAGVVLVGGAGWLLWMSRYIILAAVGTAAVVALVSLLALKSAAGHRPLCPGIHCPGCPG